MRGRWMYVGMLVILLLLAFFLYKRYRVAPDINLSAMALTDGKGDRVSLARYAGKPLIVSFAASWCGPCMKELAELNKVRHEVGEVAEIVVVSDESADAVERLRARAEGYEVLKMHESFASLGIHSIPTTYFLNGAGKVVKKKVGYIDWTDPGNRMHLLKVMQ